MTVIYRGDTADDWEMTATDDEPDEVRQLAQIVNRQVRSRLRGIPSSQALCTFVTQARARAMRNANQQTPKQRAAAFALANLIHLTRQDRLDLAESVVGRDVTSWSELSWQEMGRVIDHMDGYVKVRHLRLDRQR